MTEAEHGRLQRAAFFALGVALTLALSWLAGVLIVRGDDSWERPLLDALNPDLAIPQLDALVIAVTDASMALYGLALIWLGVASLVLRRAPRLRRAVVVTTLLVGGLVAAVAFALDDHESRSVVLWMSGFVLVAFGLVARRLHAADERALSRYARLLGVTLLAAAATVLVADVWLDGLVDRPRPFHDANAGWNVMLRAVPGEYATRGSGYVSGHASQLFALLTPLALLLARGRAYLQAGLVLAWAAVHSWTRLYVAAHFPTDVVVASIDGAVIGTLAFWYFYRRSVPHEEFGTAGGC